MSRINHMEVMLQYFGVECRDVRETHARGTTLMYCSCTRHDRATCTLMQGNRRADLRSITFYLQEITTYNFEDSFFPHVEVHG